jgi:hypothetical protein
VARTLLYALFIMLLTHPVFSQNSILSSGQWFKIGVKNNGVYSITSDQLKKMGFNTNDIDPKKIKIYGQRGGMLPQLNSEIRPVDLTELAIIVNGEEDGKMNSGDHVLFYGEGPDRYEFTSSKKVFYYEHNLYSDKNYYFITIGDTNGKRIPSDDVGSGGTAITVFEDFIHHEIDEINELESGREWFGENFNFNNEQVFALDLPGLTNSPITFVSEVMAQSFSPSSFKIFFNDQAIGEQVVPIIQNSTYAIKGRTKKDSIIFIPSNITSSNQAVKYSFQRASSAQSEGFLNFFSIHFTRKLALYGSQTVFRSAENENSACLFTVENVGTNHMIWNISDPYSPRKQLFQPQNSSATFTSPMTEGVPEFIVFDTKFLVPELTGTVSNQNLHGSSVPDYIIVTYPDFKAEADRLANHRASQNNWATMVVTPQQIYNEFSSGRQDVTAIRDLMKYYSDKSPGKLRALLLFGKCSFDYKNRVQVNTNFVPTYESRNSLAPLETYSSDDYFGFLEENEGEWLETNFAQSHTLDIGVGRIPVKSIREARIVVDKLIDYDKNANRFGSWRKDIVFVADDGSTSDNWTSIHQAQANSLAETIEIEKENFNTRKLFLGTYTKEVYPFGERAPQVNDEITKEFNRSLIINYTGHGAEKIWADEYILTEQDITELKNKNLPFLVTATCEFGRHDNPNPEEISSAELALLKEKAGCVGLVTTARPVNSSTNFALNNAFYEALFSQESLLMGEVFRLTKNNSTSGVGNRNFSLLGDPAMKLAVPQLKIRVDEIKSASGSETLKALSTVIIKGSVVDNGGTIINNFNGVLHAALFDKKTTFETVGQNNPPYSFKEWYNPLFKGKAVVNEGSFEFECILPKNIAYEVGSGKLSLYAQSSDQTMDASGGTTAFDIGGSEEDVADDLTSPELQVYLGDTSFIDGGKVYPNTTLLVKVMDESGLNISNYGIGNTAMAILDDEETFLLNEYFEAESNTYKTGWINYPLENLTPGEHIITIKIWDTFNNPAEKTVKFYVTENPGLEIEEFSNYPNPFPGKTTFVLVHNRPGEDLDITLTLLNMAGQTLKEWQILLPSSSDQESIEFDDSAVFGEILAPGLYLGRVSVRSLSDGSENSAVTKLIVSN